MKLRKIFLMIAACMICVLTIIPTVSNATSAVPSRWYSISKIRTRTNEGLGYSIYNHNSGGTGQALWNIRQLQSHNSGTFVTPQQALYCLRAGEGFQDGVREEQEYNSYYDMLTERETIKNLVETGDDNSKDTYKNLVEHDNGNTYNKILALLDLMYVPNQSLESYKQELVDAACEDLPDYEDYLDLGVQVTDDDIEATQQAALWYFTNGKIYSDTKYDHISQRTSDWLYYTTERTSGDVNGYKPLSDYKQGTLGIDRSAGEGAIREDMCEHLYTYLIEQAEANANNYKDGSQSKNAPITITAGQITCTESSNKNAYIIGPITTSVNGSTAGTTLGLTITDSKSQSITNYTVLNAQKENTNLNAMKTAGTYYISIPKGNINPGALQLNFSLAYKGGTTFTLWTNDSVNNEQPIVEIKKDGNITQNTPFTVDIPEPKKGFDLALRKYITHVNDQEVPTRKPTPDTTPLTGKTDSTAKYAQRKDPVEVKENDIVTYNIEIFNEGEQAGRATKIVDKLPTGLVFDSLVTTDKYSANYEQETNTLTLTRTSTEDNLEPFTGGTIDSEIVTIKCKVVATQGEDDKTLTNVAWISEAVNSTTGDTIDEEGDDVDSLPSTTPDVDTDSKLEPWKGDPNNKNPDDDSSYFWRGQEDDDDFEKVVIPGEVKEPEDFDLKLIKKVSAINGVEVPDRLEEIDVNRLNITNGDTTANYKLNKEPLHVKHGDILTYTFMVFNEGYVDGYAAEITENIPEGLEFLMSEKTGEELEADEELTSEEKEAIKFNQERGWVLNPESNMITTDYLSKDKESVENGNLIPAFGKNDGTKTREDLKYKEVQVMFRVTEKAKSGESIRNEAEISKDTDSKGNEIDDRDSKTEEWPGKEPSHQYQDDEDYDNVVLESFDLALRKFVVAITNNPEITSMEDNELTGYLMTGDDGLYQRAPVVDTTKLNTVDEDGTLITTAEYNQTKEPVTVTVGDYVIYMMRVYNEGDIDGYASIVKDHLPKYLEFVDNEFNKFYGWEVDEEDQTIRTNYLEDQLIEKAEKTDDGYELSYKEVPVMCRVSSSVQTDYKVTNIADVAEYKDDQNNEVEDRDSKQDNVDPQEEEDKPSYKDDETGDYIPGQEDDDDFEKVVVRIFDLALRKWVSEVIVTEDGKTTTTETGHQPYDNPEQTVKVDLNRKKLASTTVKFRYGIRITNEGGIPGYATEITDYIPEGLEFIAEDNPDWTYEGNNIAKTRQLENTLLQPGEYADISIVLKWVNDANGNLGLKVNTAEISEDYNEYGVPDVDSTPDNQKPGEDDIDDAQAILSITTGRVPLYLGLGMVSLTTLAGGVFGIKKYVL